MFAFAIHVLLSVISPTIPILLYGIEKKGFKSITITQTIVQLSSVKQKEKNRKTITGKYGKNGELSISSHAHINNQINVKMSVCNVPLMLVVSFECCTIRKMIMRCKCWCK